MTKSFQFGDLVVLNSTGEEGIIDAFTKVDEFMVRKYKGSVLTHETAYWKGEEVTKKTNLIRTLMTSIFEEGDRIQVMGSEKIGVIHQQLNEREFLVKNDISDNAFNMYAVYSSSQMVKVLVCNEGNYRFDIGQEVQCRSLEITGTVQYRYMDDGPRYYISDGSRNFARKESELKRPSPPYF